MSKVQTNSGLVNAKVTRLDGTVTKIVDVSSRSYKMAEGRAIAPKNLIKQGRMLVEIESTAGVTDSGLGYAVLPKETKKKTETKVKTESKSETKQPKQKPRRVREEEQEEDLQVERKEIRGFDHATVTELRSTIELAVRSALSQHYSNFDALRLGMEMTSPENPTNVVGMKANISFNFSIEKPASESLSDETIAATSPGMWEKIAEKDLNGYYTKIKALLDLEEEELEIGARLVHEDGSVYLFAGVSADRKAFVLQDEDGEPVTIRLSAFEEYDLDLTAPEDASDEDELDLDAEDDADEDELSLDDAEEEEIDFDEMDLNALRTFAEVSDIVIPKSIVRLGEESVREFVQAEYEASLEETDEDDLGLDGSDEEDEDDLGLDDSDEGDDDLGLDDSDEDEDEDEEDAAAWSESDIRELNMEECVELAEEYEINIPAKLIRKKLLKRVQAILIKKLVDDGEDEDSDEDSDDGMENFKFS